MDIVRIELDGSIKVYINGKYVERCEVIDPGESGFKEWVNSFRGFKFYAIEVKAEYELIDMGNGNCGIKFL